MTLRAPDVITMRVRLQPIFTDKRARFFHKLKPFYAHNSHIKMFVEFMRFVDGHDPQDLNQLLLLTGFILFIYLENGSSQAEAFITFL